MLNNPKTRRVLTILMPILSLIVAVSIVTQQYFRKSSLEQHILMGERESKELISKLPKGAKQAAIHKDDHDHHPD